MDVAVLSDRLQHEQVERVDRRQPVDGEPPGKVEADDAGPKRVEGGRHQFRERSDANPLAERTPQPRLPEVAVGERFAVAAEVVTSGP